MAKPLLQILPNLTILNIQIYNIILKPSGIESSKEMVQYILKVVICIDTTILMFMLMHASHGLFTMTINRCIHGTKDSGQTFENECNQGLVTIKGSFHLSMLL